MQQRLKQYFSSRLARKLLSYFLIASIIPIGITAYLSYQFTLDQSLRQTQKQLKSESKLFIYGLQQRFNLVNKILSNVHVDKQDIAANTEYLSEMSEIDEVSLIRVYEQSSLVNQLDYENIRNHLNNKKGQLFTAHENGKLQLYLAFKTGTNRYRLGLIDKASFFNLDAFIDKGVAIVITDHDGTEIYTLKQADVKLETKQDSASNSVDSSFFLQWSLNHPTWNIHYRFPDSRYLFSTSEFSRIYIPALILSILLIILMINALIQKNLIPLNKLITLTRKTSQGDFTGQLSVNTHDEFEELCDAFSGMNRSLDKLFSTIHHLSEVDKLIINTFSIEKIAKKIIESLYDVLDIESASISFFDNNEHYSFLTSQKGFEKYASKIDVKELMLAYKNSGPNTVGLAEFETICKNLFDNNEARISYIPVRGKGKITALLAVSFTDLEKTTDIEEFLNALANRLEIAISTQDKEQRLYQQAHFDPLTGLANRQLTKDRARREIAHAHRNKQQFAVLFIDLDRFKNVNDSLGHDYGDRLLKQVSNRLESSIRETDFAARLGGDEFVVLLSELHSPIEAGYVAQNIITTLSEPAVIDHHQLFVGASIGISIYPNDGETIEELLKNADTAMYQAKSAGRGLHIYFEEKMNQQATKRVKLEASVRYLLDNHLFMINLQPIYNHRADRYDGAEVLLRWKQSERKIDFNTFELISIAEETGLIVDIGDFVIDESLRQLKYYLEQDFPIKYIAINVSPRQFADPKFTHKLEEKLIKYQLPYSMIELEITESILVSDDKAVYDSLYNLKSKGIKIVIDDFGTGYSSFSYIKKFPIDKIKIDQSFIFDINDNPSSKAIVKSIIGMCNELDIPSVCEGVETEEHFATLREMGSYYLQGYHFQRPQTAEAFTELLQNQFNRLNQD